MSLDHLLINRLNAAMAFSPLDGPALTRMLGCHKSTVHRWISRQANPPTNVVEWVERLAAFLAANPAPATWRRAYKHLDLKTEGLPTTVDRGSHDETSPALGSAPVHPALSDAIGGGSVAPSEHPDLGQRGEGRDLAAG